MEPFIGQITSFGFNFPPRGWGNCNGAMMSINQNTALYSLLGTTYGGDGRVTFALPDLRGRSAINMGQGPGLPDYRQGVRGGTTNTTLTTAQLPAHNHQMPAHNHQLRATSATATDTAPGNTKLLASTGRDVKIYATPGTLVPLLNTSPNQAISELAAGPTANTGGGTAFNNLPPYLVIETCIALQGIFPSRN